MVLHGLCTFSDPRDEAHRLDEIIEAEGSLDRLTIQGPVGELDESLVDLLGSQFVHRAEFPSVSSHTAVQEVHEVFFHNDALYRVQP